MYSNKHGIMEICKNLDRLGIKPQKSNKWAKSTVNHILTNPTYIGKILYENNRTVKRMQDGKIIRVKNNNSELITVDGIHEPIISIELWDKVQEIKKNNLITCTKIDYSIKNPLAGLIKCESCGKAMSRVTYSGRNDVRLCCRNCSNVIGSNIDMVEDKLIQSLKIYLKKYKLDIKNNDNSDSTLLLQVNKDSIKNTGQEIETLQKQLNATYDLLEQGVYTNELFLERSNSIKTKIDELKKDLLYLEKESEKIEQLKNHKEIIAPSIEKIIDVYQKETEPKLKNELLKTVLEKVTYSKINPKSPEDFKLTLYLKLF